jgi:hypothetical protein
MAMPLRPIGVIVGALALAFGAAQLIQPDRANPAIEPAATLEAHLAPNDPAAGVFSRACRDCHSNATVWPGYSQVAPLSWVMAAAVIEGRKAVNFSEWGGYTPERRRELLAQSCRDATAGKMPGSAWILLHPQAQLSAKDIDILCAAGREA